MIIERSTFCNDRTFVAAGTLDREYTDRARRADANAAARRLNDEAAGTDKASAKVLVAADEVAVKYGASIAPPEEMPATLSVDADSVPPIARSPVSVPPASGR